MAKDDKKIQPADETQAAPVPPVAEHPIEPRLTAEQQAEVARLAASIAETEKPPADPAADPAPVEPSAAPGSCRDDAAMCVDMFVEMSVAYCPAVAPLWPQEKKEAVASALGRVFEKYNFTFAGFGPEIGLLMAAGPVLWQTSKVIAQQMNEQAAVPEQVRAPIPPADPPIQTA